MMPSLIADDLGFLLCSVERFVCLAEDVFDGTFLIRAPGRPGVLSATGWL